MDLGLRGRTVIVTGGSSNIGRGILLAFAAEGSNIVNADIDVEQGRKAVDQANSTGGHAILVETDVTDWDSAQAMVKTTLDRFGRIDVLVNNAGGTTGMARFINKEREEWAREIDLNYWSVINCTRAVVDNMIERRYGRIVNISSNGGINGQAAISTAVYGGLKGGVMALSRALAWEFGEYGITVNCASPGWIVPHSRDDTGRDSFWNKFGYDYFTPEKLEGYTRSWPVRRLGRPEDIAYTVLFFASEHAGFLTGQTVSVSGGGGMW